MSGIEQLAAGAIDLQAVMSQRAEADAMAKASERGAAAASYARKAGVHLWVVSFVHHVTAEQLSSGEEPVFSAESLIRTPGVQCMLCGTPYSPVLLKRRCAAGRRIR